MSREEFNEALAALTEAVSVYRVLNDHAVGESTDTVWSPIYTDLLAELAARLRTTGVVYDRPPTKWA